VRIAARQELVPGKSVLCIGRARFMLSASSQAGEAQVMSATQSIMIQGSVIIPGAVLRNRSAQEALLVMDVCDSTSLARRCGEDAVCRSVGLLTQMIETGPSGPTILFLKCTGDGFFATFPDVGAALGAAQDLLGWLRRHGADIGVPDLAIRIGVHYGEVQTDQSGDRLGLAANLVFRLQAATGQERIKPPAGPAELPARNRILLTDVAVHRLSAAERAKARSAGHFLFKGFDFPVEVYLWS
jgi:class 3 adenylate cyclase